MNLPLNSSSCVAWCQRHSPRRPLQLKVPDDRRRLPAPRCVRRVDRLLVEAPDGRRVVWVLRRQPLAVVDRPPFVVQKWRRDAGLLASEHPESERERRGEVLAREARVHRDVSELAVATDTHERQLDVADQAALIRYDEVPAAAQDPRELAERAVDLGEVHERDRADDEVDRVVGKRELVKIRLVELPAWDLLP